jgi:hypothetical protein
MENQQIFNLVVGIAAFFGGWVLNNITRSLERLDKEMRTVPVNYITKSDYHRDVDEIKNICKQIFDKLDNKADKP